MTVPGHRQLVYVDSDPVLRRLADATFRGEYIVESAASVEDLDDRIEPEVAMINLSDTAYPQPIWDSFCQQWPTVPVVIVLTTEAAAERDREALWALGPASMVVNPFSPDAMPRGVAAALS